MVLSPTEAVLARLTGTESSAHPLPSQIASCFPTPGEAAPIARNTFSCRSSRTASPPSTALHEAQHLATFVGFQYC